MEFLGAIADAGQGDGVVNIATGLFQPIAAADVAAVVAEVATSAPRSGTIEIAGPERAPFDEIIKKYLEMTDDKRAVHADPEARSFGRKGRALLSRSHGQRAARENYPRRLGQAQARDVSIVTADSD